MKRMGTEVLVDYWASESGVVDDGSTRRFLAAKKIQKVARGFLIRRKKQEIEKRRLEEDIEQVKISSMHELVDRVAVNVLDTCVEVNCLYLTNKQAAQVSLEKMRRVREHLDIKDVQMVIRLMPCHFGASFQNTFPHFCDGEGGGRFPHKDIPESSALEREKAEHQLILLVKDVLLPLARQTRSLVIGSESCALTAAFVKVSASVQRQLGQDCPFRLLILAKAYFYDVCSNNASKVAYHIKRASAPWKSAQSQRGVLTNLYGDDEAFWPGEDLPTGSYSLIMFECLDDGKHASQTSSNFANDFISSLSLDFPVIALQTYGTNKMNTMPALADHVTRGLPLMLLDSRKRDLKPNLELAMMNQKTVAMTLHEGDVQWSERCDQYFTSAMAYIKGCLDQDNNIDKKRKASQQKPGDDVEKDHQLWLWEAIEDRLEDTCRDDDASLPLSKAEDNSRTRTMKATDFLLDYVGGELEWESMRLQQRCSEAIEKVENAPNWGALAACLEDTQTWCKIRGCCFHFFKEAHEFAKVHEWLEIEHRKFQSAKGTLVMKVVHANTLRFDFEDEKAKLVALLKSAFAESVAYDAKVKTRRSFRANQDLWVSVYDILSASNVHTGNIHELKQVNSRLNWILFNLAQIDRLPRKNTLEALVLLRTAWTIVDVYNKIATRYKWKTRATYICTLLLGVATVTFSVACQRYDEFLNDTVEHSVLLALALLGSFLTAFAALVDPAQKWIQLRNGAYALEAEIWKFRARVHPYGSAVTSTHGRLASERRAEGLLQEAILRIQGGVRLSTGLKETSFYSMTVTIDNLDPPKPLFQSHLDEGSSRMFGKNASTPSMAIQHSETRALLPLPPDDDDGPTQADKKWLRKLKDVHFKHNQFKKAHAKRRDPQDPSDSYHAPAKPEEYIKWRLVPKMDFYKRRIPRYACMRRLCQGLLLTTALATSLLAYLKMTSWCAIIAALTSAVASFQEFLDVASKLQRYSAVANSLGNILISWQALDRGEKSAMKNVNRLVMETEEVLCGERNAWIGTELRTRQRMDEVEKRQDERKGAERKA